MDEPLPSPAHAADYNLLFGVVALQSDLIDPRQFVEACAAWAACKSRPLADLLLERGWITPADQADVERLLRRKVRKHGGDVRASLAAAVDPAMRQSLAAVADAVAVVRESLGAWPSLPPSVYPPFGLEGGPPRASAGAASEAGGPERRGHYILRKLYARGGLGRVWVAHDAEVGRDVALKELRPEALQGPQAEARFLEEARITGQLEHPAIVPVYEVA